MTVRWASAAFLGLLLATTAACASTGGSSGEAGTSSTSREVITEGEMAGMDHLTVYEAIRRLRPNWLRYRGQGVLEGPDREGLRVYLDGSFFGDAESVGGIQVQNVQEIRFLDARQATLRFGTGHTVGAILVTSRRGP